VVWDNEASPPEGGIILELKASAELPPEGFRTSVYGRKEESPLVPEALLYDAESLALATLVHRGLVLGPERKAQTIDRGIHWRDMPLLGGCRGPVVRIEWGANTSQDHLLKSIAAGLLQFRQFLGSPRPERPETGDQTVRIGRVDLRRGSDEESVSILLSLQGPQSLFPSGEEVPEDLDFETVFWIRDGKGSLLLAAANPVVVYGGAVSVPDDDRAVATFQLVIPLGKVATERLREHFFGFSVQVLWKGRLQDRRSTPESLEDQSWRTVSILDL
ncbi:MAG: hypothetical protein AAF191_19810, partial [Verrucomicrobiota bacterium]